LGFRIVLDQPGPVDNKIKQPDRTRFDPAAFFMRKQRHCTPACGVDNGPMTKKNAKRKSKPASKGAEDENPGIEFLTVAWALSVMTGLLCDLGAAGTRFLIIDEADRTLAMLSGLLFFAAAVVGLISLGLMAIVLRMRSESPPRGFVVFAIVVAIAPWVALLVQLLR
jgi:hypothetical protein